MIFRLKELLVFLLSLISRKLLSLGLGFRSNKYHPLVWINGEPVIGENVYIGGFTEINASNCPIQIGRNCDIASFVSINCADSHLRCIDKTNQIDRRPIVIGDNVFVGSHSVILGGVSIGDNSVIGAGTVLAKVIIPPYSLVVGNPAVIKEGYYLQYENPS